MSVSCIYMLYAMVVSGSLPLMLAHDSECHLIANRYACMSSFESDTSVHAYAEELIEKIEAAMSEQDFEAMASLIDTPAIIRQIELRELWPEGVSMHNEQVLEFMEWEFCNLLLSPDSGYMLQGLEIRSVRALTSVWLVSGDQTDSEGIVTRVVLWLTPASEDEGARLRDIEMVDGLNRFSTIAGIHRNIDGVYVPADFADYQLLFEVYAAWGELDFPAMQELLQEIDIEDMPDSFRRLCRTMQGLVMLNLSSDRNDAIEYLVPATSGQGTSPTWAYLLLAEAYSDAGFPEEALNALGKFEDRAGIAADTQFMRGIIYETAEDHDQAWDCYIEAMALCPTNGWALYSLAEIVTDETADQFNQCYAMLEEPEEWFPYMLQAAEESRDENTVRRIADAHRLVFANDPLLQDAEDILLEFQRESDQSGE